MERYTPVISKSELIHGEYYEGKCRNSRVARWNGRGELFHYWKMEWGQKFVAGICCPEDDDEFDVFVAYRQLDPEEVLEDIPL